MKLLPTEAGARRRLMLMGGALVVMAAAWFMWGGGPEYVVPQTLGPAATSKPSVAGRGAGARQAKGPVTPKKLRLAEMETVPDEPEAGRNLFQFGTHPPPPPPKPTPLPPPPPYVEPPKPTPPPIPPVQLWLTTVFPAADGTLRAYLHDKPGNSFEGVEGDTIDGRYKLLKVGAASVVLINLDGTGQVTRYIGG